MVGGGRVETWEIAREGVDEWGRGEQVKDVMEKGELDVSVVVDGRQGLDGMGWGGMHGKGHVCQGLHLAYVLRKW